MQKLYYMCILSALVGYIHDVKAHPVGVQCGVVGHGRRKPRILYGNIAEDSQFPWIASIKRNGVHMCGGSIISGRFILSASHCFDELRDYYDWSITLGEYDQAVNETFSASYNISRVIKHSNYNISRSSLKNDIVLLELTENIQWTDHIQPICLPNKNIERFNSAFAAGWGPDILQYPPIPDDENSKLRFVKLDIFENDHCNARYREKNLSLRLVKTQMCAGASGEIRDTSSGDSGGPLVVQIEGRHVLVGITSAGTVESIYPKPPGVYTRVYSYMEWIMEHIHEVLYYPPILTNQIH